MVLSAFNQTFTAMTSDSRKVQKGALFLAYPGSHSDGRDYIVKAIEAGATGVAWEKDGFTWNSVWQVENMAITGLKNQVGEIAAEFYHHPSKKLGVIGVTGTNGKTSVSQWIAQALSVLGQKAAVIGTIGNGFVDAQTEAVNTTPDAILLQAMLADFKEHGADAVAMEVSSHGLHQGRLNGVTFDLAVLTHLSRDHLDYHETMEEYAAAKARLFSWQGLRKAVLNADDDFGVAIASALNAQGKPMMTYGINAGDVRALSLQLQQHGIVMQVVTPLGEALVTAPVIGRFNAYNVLAVLTTLLAFEVSLKDAVAAIAKIKPVLGRMQKFGGDDKPLVVVDYAHTPDALENVLLTLREQTQGQLICVFGCGGERDVGKRPLMGEVATRLADHVIVTSDNPRSENPQRIIQQIVQGMAKLPLVEADRAIAIQQAVQMAHQGDIVLVAGKGHESYQETSGVKHGFSDAVQVSLALSNVREVLV